MLAEIAIANAAFGVIKEAIGNGKDLYEMGSVVAQFFDQKNALQKKSNKNGYKSDMEAFMELEKIKEMEEHFKTTDDLGRTPRYVGRLASFSEKAKEEREQREREEREKRAYYAQMALYVLYSICGLAIFVPTLFLILTILKQ